MLRHTNLNLGRHHGRHPCSRAVQLHRRIVRGRRRTPSRAWSVEGRPEDWVRYSGRAADHRRGYVPITLRRYAAPSSTREPAPGGRLCPSTIRRARPESSTLRGLALLLKPGVNGRRKPDTPDNRRYLDVRAQKALERSGGREGGTLVRPLGLDDPDCRAKGPEAHELERTETRR